MMCVYAAALNAATIYDCYYKIRAFKKGDLKAYNEKVLADIVLMQKLADKLHTSTLNGFKPSHVANVDQAIAHGQQSQIVR